MQQTLDLGGRQNNYKICIYFIFFKDLYNREW